VPGTSRKLKVRGRGAPSSSARSRESWNWASMASALSAFSYCSTAEDSGANAKSQILSRRSYLSIECPCVPDAMSPRWAAAAKAA